MSDDSDELNFEGKVVSFSTCSDTLAMKNIRFGMQKNRLFLICEVPESATKNNWAANRPCAIAWDSIVDYIIFDSEQQYIELISKSD